ncbi:CobW family GTP-binding protein [Herbaspirillum autotrophicum]|uniref:CobW family GTP-binding protein n=1 Tax=Herbaspirillum autotrophicum TaxID=180195 RepID=UPI00067BB7C0|nr:GTP-binding protein [Herbaspirillum autotrophicum]
MDLIPVTLLTGFLGSGKTTLLNRLVRHPDLHRTLIIINEFGEIGLDHLLVTNSEEDLIVEMSSGCMCCTIRKDLANTLRDITWRFARDGICQFDRVLIETTGLADPAPILHTLITDTFIAGHYKLDGIITTVDAASGNATLDAHPESVKQIAVADRLLLTKTDVATTDAVAGLQQRLLEINPAAPQISVSNGDLNPASILNLGLFDTTTKSANVQRWLQQEAYTLVSASRAPYRLNYLSRGKHNDINRHNDRIQAFCYVIDEPVTGDVFEQWIGTLTMLRGEKMLRVKGLINVKGEPGPVVIHGVQHIFHPPVFLETWPSPDHRSRIVFITQDLKPIVISETFKQFGTLMPAAESLP